jgi:hypothetical protein
MGIRCADHATPYIHKIRYFSLTSSDNSVGIVRSRTKATEFVLFVCLLLADYTVLKSVKEELATRSKIFRGTGSFSLGGNKC